MGRLDDIQRTDPGGFGSETTVDDDPTGTDIRFPEGTAEPAVRLRADVDDGYDDVDDASTARPAPVVAGDRNAEAAAPRGPKLAQVVESAPRGKRLAAHSQPRMQAVPDPTEQSAPQAVDDVDTAPIKARGTGVDMGDRVDDDDDGLEEETDCLTVVESAESLVEQLARDIEANSDMDQTRIDVPRAEESEIHAVVEQTTVGHRTPNWSDPRELEEPMDWATSETTAAPEPVVQEDTRPIKLSALVTAQAEPIHRPATLGTDRGQLASTESVPAIAHRQRPAGGLPWALIVGASAALGIGLIVTLALVL